MKKIIFCLILLAQVIVNSVQAQSVEVPRPVQVSTTHTNSGLIYNPLTNWWLKQKFTPSCPQNRKTSDFTNKMIQLTRKDLDPELFNFKKKLVDTYQKDTNCQKINSDIIKDRTIESMNPYPQSGLSKTEDQNDIKKYQECFKVIDQVFTEFVNKTPRKFECGLSEGALKDSLIKAQSTIRPEPTAADIKPGTLPQKAMPAKTAPQSPPLPIPQLPANR